MGKFIYAVIPMLLLVACAPPVSPNLGAAEESCDPKKEECTEEGINAPKSPVAGEPEEPRAPEQPGVPVFHLPAFDPSWELKQSVYEKAVAYYYAHAADFPNLAYVSVVDFSQHSSKQRFYLFDLTTGQVSRYLTAHGKNSDSDNDGYATSFSNTEGSLKSSLGAYRTLATYSGNHGYSMRLTGLESTNDNAYERAIVVHPADYVQESKPSAGRSWGCPALDPSVSRGIIDKIKNGSLLYIGT